MVLEDMTAEELRDIIRERTILLKKDRTVKINVADDIDDEPEYEEYTFNAGECYFFDEYRDGGDLECVVHGDEYPFYTVLKNNEIDEYIDFEDILND